MGKTSPLLAAIVIADAGPLIDLDELGALAVLADFEQILVPDAFWREVEHHRPAALQRMPALLLRQLSTPWLRCSPCTLVRKRC